MQSRYLINRLRSITALIMFGFIFIHLGNNILGLVGIEAMEAMRNVTTNIVHSPIGTAVLAGSLLIHFSIAMRVLYYNPFLNLPRWQQLQLISGITLILLLIPHAVPIRGIHQGFEVETSYPLILQHIWLDLSHLLQQIALVIVAWLHLCLGLHFWLKTKSWYRKNLFWIYALAVLWPILALIGFAQAGYEAFDYDIPELDNPEISAQILKVESGLLWSVVLISVLILILKQLKKTLIADSRACRISIDESQIKASTGQTILIGLRFANFPHASVCGGRGRCTTCRVRVNLGMDKLDQAGELEKLALKRINAPPTVRLACQAVIRGDVNLTALLPADATMRQAQPMGGLSGEEREIVAMFVDLRGSTKLAEYKLPYDVLYLLNQFFTQMSKSLHKTNGHYAQFAGDGLMALYGLNTDLKTGCHQALQGALDMIVRLENLNEKMKSDLEQPLKIGIGLHCGDAIVGNMGPPKSPNFSAIGDNINIAARLEAQTKVLNCLIVVSKQLLDHAAMDLTGLNAVTVPIRGRENTMQVYAIETRLQLQKLLTQ